ncbi:hypothetical protein HDU92_000880, partial [Lobulomyces angularis]
MSRVAHSPKLKNNILPDDVYTLPHNPIDKEDSVYYNIEDDASTLFHPTPSAKGKSLRSHIEKPIRTLGTLSSAELQNRVRELEIEGDHKDKRVADLEMQMQQLLAELPDYSTPELQRSRRVQETSHVNSEMSKMNTKMLLTMADAIPVISAQFSRGEVFSHLEAFDTFVTTSKLYGLFQDTFAIMTSFNKLASSHQIQCRITFKVSDDCL